MNIAKIKERAEAGDRVRLFPPPIAIDVTTSAIDVYQKAFDLAVEGRSVVLITESGRRIPEISASEIHSFETPDWFIMRKQLVFRMRSIDAGEWDVMVDFVARPPTICPNCKARLW